MTKSIKSVIVLTAVCLVMALALGTVNYFTASVIEQNEADRATIARQQVRPGAKSFEKVDLADYEGIPNTVTEFYTDDIGGYVAVLLTKGYKTGLKIMCGVDSDGKVTGCVCLASNETLGYEKEYGNQLLGATLLDIDTVDTVASATLTTAAYRAAVKDALGTVAVYLGGDFDGRSEEEKKLDAALPEAEGRFTEWFMTERISGVERVFIADNGKGYVFFGDGSYVGADENGAAKAESSIDTASAVATVRSASLTEISISDGMGIGTAVTAAYRSATGNIVLELEAEGYGIKGGKHASGKPISIKLSVDKDGKIISVKTVSQFETEGLGSACGDYSFYSQLFGRSKQDCRDIDAISSATVTTDGYLSAIEEGLSAFEILKEEGT